MASPGAFKHTPFVSQTRSHFYLSQTPSKVVDPDTVSKDVLRERPLAKKSAFYCVRFFPIGDQ